MSARRGVAYRLSVALSLGLRWIASSWRVFRLAEHGPGIEAQAGVRFIGRPHIALGRSVRLMRGATLWATDRGYVRVGDRSYVGDHSWIVANAEIRIGADVLIAPFCYIQDTDHGFAELDIPINRQHPNSSPIVIDDDVWLGAHVVVTRGVHIGRGAVVGAGSVVTRDIPPWTVAVGAPARPVRKRDAGVADSG